MCGSSDATITLWKLRGSELAAEGSGGGNIGWTNSANSLVY